MNNAKHSIAIISTSAQHAFNIFFNDDPAFCSQTLNTIIRFSVSFANNHSNIFPVSFYLSHQFYSVLQTITLIFYQHSFRISCKIPRTLSVKPTQFHLVRKTENRFHEKVFPPPSFNTENCNIFTELLSGVLISPDILKDYFLVFLGQPTRAISWLTFCLPLPHLSLQLCPLLTSLHFTSLAFQTNFFAKLPDFSHFATYF